VPKVVNLISNIDNGAGLARDADLLANLIDKLGHKWRKIAYDRPFEGLAYQADISIFLEVMIPGMLQYSPINYLVPNSEWWNRNGECSLPFMNKIICKTRDCFNIWEKKCPGKCVYTGFESTDFLNTPLPAEKENNFLHLAGNSRTKNTEAVVQAWRQFKIPYHLEVIVRDLAFVPLCVGVKNVTHYARVPEPQVQCALNVRQFHLMPSHYEGYGHVLHEALGCGGIVLTTDAPPMNEFDGIPKELLIPSSDIWTKELATCHRVTPEAVYEAVMKAGALSKERRDELSLIARAAFLKDREDFRKRFAELLV
jgi:hypothetical protein